MGISTRIDNDDISFQEKRESWNLYASLETLYNLSGIINYNKGTYIDNNRLPEGDNGDFL